MAVPDAAKIEMPGSPRRTETGKTHAAHDDADGLTVPPDPNNSGGDRRTALKASDSSSSTGAASLRGVDFVRRVRDGKDVSEAEVSGFVRGIVDGSVAEYQTAAFLMAVYFRGLPAAGTAALTRAMQHSGRTLQWDSAISPLVVDKHSTGGVGDKISLPLAPLAAAAGIKVPMISGQGLGHTGGTLDKLESIPGFKWSLSLEEIETQVSSQLGIAMAGQTADIAPADRELYALRDVTATVESVPLIASSIMAKKLAAGLSGLVLDVKVGSGAFMKTEEDARKLAAEILSIATNAGVRLVAVLTNMDEPLGRFIGNAFEVQEAITILKDPAAARAQFRDTYELTVDLAAEMLVIGRGLSYSAALSEAKKRLESGEAYAKFRELVAAQGATGLELTLASRRASVIAGAAGFVAAIDAQSLGMVVMQMGGGRAVLTDSIDHSVGIEVTAKVGTAVQPDSVLAYVYIDSADPEQFVQQARAAFTISDTAPAPRPLIIAKLRNF